MIPKLLHIRELSVYLLIYLVLSCTTHAFDVNSTTLSIAENQSAGTVVGEINASASSGNFTFNVSAHTSQAGSADTLGAIGISFFVNGAWTANETFFTAASLGSVKTKSFFTASKPTKLKFSSGSNVDAWGYWKITSNGTVILANPNGISGSPIGTQPYWVDGDASHGTVANQIHTFPSQSYTFSLVDGNGSSGNALFSLESNGTLKTAAVLDFETNASHSIRVRATDELNASVEKSFVVQVTDVNFSGATYVFTNAGVTGREGPNQAQVDSNYSGTNLANSVTVNTQGIQEWVVPADGNYSIEAWGGQGGRGGTDSSVVEGGQGAKSKGVFSLSANNALKILVGQGGLGGGDSVGGGGGGASFVVLGSNSPLIVAGGGGGGSYHSTHGPGIDSRIGGNGKVELSSSTSAGATHNASGGAGFQSNSVAANYAGIASSFTNGGSGATGKTNHHGGFGGGGGGSSSYPSGGGGGGYRGGDASGLSWTQSVGQSKGGYSFNSGTSKENSSTLGFNLGHGRVIITQLSGDSPTPSNQAPGNLQSVSSLSISENQPAGSIVGELNATDANNADTLTYALVDGNGSSGNTLFTLEANGTLKTAAILDFEANASHSIRVRVSDDHNASAEKVFDVNVTDDANDNSNGATYLFTNAGNSGRLGPNQSQIDANYSGTNLANSVTINTQGIQEWVVPATGNYRIEAFGAQGGNGNPSDSNTAGGKGSAMKGNFLLNSGETLKILVGQNGKGSTLVGGGGGGSFVTKAPYDSNGSILVIAGGGGGGVKGSWSSVQFAEGGHAPVGQNGGDSEKHATNYGSVAPGPGGGQRTYGGSVGYGGGGGVGGGGGGFFGNGGTGHNGAESGTAYANGGSGGSGSRSDGTADGGFGGGGGGYQDSSGYGGAGGGYSGGGGGTFNGSGSGGGGGGSFNSGTDQNNTGGTNQGHGRVIITNLSGSATSTLNNGLVAWYPLDGNGTDQSPTANHATVYGATPTADRRGEAGKALLFGGSGSNDYVQAPFNQALSSSSLSYSVWAKPTSTTTNHGSPITFRGNGGGFNLYKMPTNIWSHWTGDGSWRKFDAQAISLNWTALAFTHDGTTGKCYQNGILVASLNKNYLPNQTGLFRIGSGSGSNGPTYFFKGAIDEVRVWNRVLSAEEISSLYTMEKPPNWLPVDLNATGTLAFSENQPTGTLVGDFNATDLDANATLSFSLLSGSNLFGLDANGSLRTLHVFDFETNASSYAISVRVTDEHNASLDGNFTITLLNQVEDLDGDGTEDHYDNDDDGDGFSDSTETAYGSDPRDSNSVANAAPNALDLNGSSIQENQAAGTLVGDFNAIDPDTNASLTYSLHSGGNLFSLDVNGSLRTLHVFDFETNASTYAISVRVTDEHNASLDGNFTITLLNQVEDLDGDGTEDYYDNDDDGDGFSDATEIAYGSDPRDSNSVANAAPIILDLNGSSIQENQTAGTLVGDFNATDPDANATLSFSLLSGGNLFSLDANGTLRTLHVFDFETNASSYAISVRVTDEHNASLDGNFTITLLNQVEDLDGDGTEDHYDNDDDGDGFSDATETAYGSDPRDPNSVANATPNALDLNGSSIQENQAAGTLVGDFNATDPDTNASITYSLHSGGNLFSLDVNGSLRTLHVFDFETNASSYAISVRVTDEHNATLDGNFTITLLNQVEDLDGDGTEDHYDSDDDGDGFSDATEIAYGSDPRNPNSVANAAPNALDLNGSSILENQPAGTFVGKLLAIDPDTNATLAFSFLSGGNLFYLDANGSLRTLHVFDFETNASSYAISVRVTDEHNASLDGNFTIALLNQVEDLDGDGTEDHYDNDEDGDGFSDATEIAYGSDPRDSNSVANAAPNALDLNGSSIQENQTAGTLVGHLLASDPDANASLSFSLVKGKGSEDNHLFYLEGAKLLTLATFDFEAGAAPPASQSSPPESNDTRPAPPGSLNDSESNASVRQPEKDSSVSSPTPIPDENQSIAQTPSSHADDGNLSFSSPLGNSTPTGPELPDSNSTRRAGESFGFENQATLFKVRIRVTDEHNASLEKAFVIELLNQIEDFDGDGVEDAFDPDDVVYLMPELGTIETILLENGRVSLSVGFKANSDFALPSFAFELSGNADFKGNLRAIPGLVEQDQIHGSVPDLNPGTTYHVRLLATHRAKQTHSSSTSFQIPSVVKHWWESESPAESGWRTSPWLGSFRPYTNGWIYHLGLGWAYAQSDGQDGLWLWMEAEGWVWSAPQCWPHLWKDRSTNWLYFVKQHEGKPALYDYVTESFRWK